MCRREKTDEVISFKRKSEKRLEYGADVAKSHGWSRITGSGNRTDPVI
jgi:hypothetical protein